MNGPFLFDDVHLPFSDPNAGHMPAGFWLGGVRPLLMATYWANYLLSGRSPFSYHFVNVGLHCLSSALVFYILKRLLALSEITSDSAWLSAAGAAIFLLHPLQTESVDYVAGRSELLCGVFVFAGWLLFLNHFRTRTTVTTALCILICAAGAVLSKESGVCLPMILVATDAYWGEGSLGQRLRKRAAVYLPLGAGFFIAVYAIIEGLRKSTTAGFAGPVSPRSYALTESRAILIYLRLFLWPSGQTLDWQLPFLHSVRAALPSLFFLAVLACGIVMLWNRARLASFGLLVFLIALAPTSSFVPIADALAERRMYVPIVGLILALLWIASRFRSHRAALAFAGGIIVIAFAFFSYHRSQLWGDDVLLWQNAIRHDVRNVRAHAALAGSYMFRKECAPAAAEYEKVVELQGVDEVNERNLATAYDCSRQNDKALASYRILVSLHPTAQEWVRLGYLEAIQNHLDVALAAFEKALLLDPNSSVAYAYRGTARYALGNPQGARSDFNRALALDPSNKVAASGLARLPAGK